MRGTMAQTLAAVGIALLLAATSACADDPRYSPTTVRPVHSVDSSSTTPTPTATNGLPEDEQVKVVYTSYVQRWSHAQDLPPKKRRTYLAQWLADPLLSAALQVIASQRSKHHRLQGTGVPHVQSLKIHGSRATLYDCSDASGFAIRDTRTGKRVSKQYSHIAYAVQARKTEMGWRIIGNEMKGSSCTAG